MCDLMTLFDGPAVIASACFDTEWYDLVGLIHVVKVLSATGCFDKGPL